MKTKEYLTELQKIGERNTSNSKTQPFVKAFYDWQIQNVTEQHITQIKNLPIANKLKHIEVKEHECFRNALYVSLADPTINYVEGFIEVHGLPIEHAWNSWNGHHFDLTQEKLKQLDTEHIAVMELSSKEAASFAHKTQLTGPYLLEKFRQIERNYGKQN